MHVTTWIRRISTWSQLIRRDKKTTAECLSLAAVLRDAASRSGMSVYQIAKESGVDQSTLNKFLNGDRDNLRLDVADRLFKFFRLRVVADGRSKLHSRIN